MALWMWAAMVGMLVCAPARADVSPLGPVPAGWTVTATETAILQSPETESGSVTVIVPVVLPAIQDFKEAFATEVPSLVEDLMGEIVAAEAPRVLPTGGGVAQGLVLTQMIEAEDGARARIDTTGFKVPGGLQLVLVARYAEMPAGEPRLLEALSLVERWRAAGFVMTPDRMADLAAAGATEDAGTLSASGDGSAVREPETSPDDRIENVIFYLRYAFEAGRPEAASEPKMLTAVLLRDGRAYEGESRAPSSFDPASRPEGSAGAGRWQRDGEGYALVFADGTQGTAVAAAAKSLAAPAALTISGTYTAASAPDGESIAAELTFFDDGSLTLIRDGTAISGTYAIAQRTITIAKGAGDAPQSYVFGFQGSRDAPELLIIGNQIYERAGTP